MKKKNMLLKAINENSNIKKDLIKIQSKGISKYKNYEIANSNIGIMNLSRGAGSTFITTNLAKALSEYEMLVAVIELPLEKPKIYINIGIEQKLSENDELGYLNFYSYPHEIDINGKIEKDKETYIDDIIFIVADPHKEIINKENWNYNKMIKLLNITRKARFNLIDINNSYEHESVKDLLEEIDILMVVIDPNPTEIILNIKKLEKIKNYQKENSLNVKYIINKYNDGVNLKELKKFLQIEPITKIPFIESTLVYKSLYEGEILYKYEGAKEILQQAFIPIFKEFLPVNLIKDSKIKKTIPKKKMFNLFRKNEK